MSQWIDSKQQQNFWSNHSPSTLANFKRETFRRLLSADRPWLGIFGGVDRRREPEEREIGCVCVCVRVCVCERVRESERERERERERKSNKYLRLYEGERS